MTEIITNPFYRVFMTLCSEAQTNIKLCAPYVKTDVISSVVFYRQQYGNRKSDSPSDMDNIGNQNSMSQII